MLTLTDVALIDDPHTIAALIEQRTPQWLADVESYDPAVADADAHARSEVEAALEQRLRVLGPWTTLVHAGTGDMIVVAGGAAAAAERFRSEFGFGYDSAANRDVHGLIWEIGDTPLMTAPEAVDASNVYAATIVWV